LPIHGRRPLFKPILRAVERRRRPLSEHSFLVLAGMDLAYGRCPHAGSEGVRDALLRLARRPGGDLPAQEHHTDYTTGTLGSWVDGLTLLSGRQLARQYPRATVFAAIRDPLDRLAACYGAWTADTPHSPPRPAVAAGLTFADFVAHVCATPDLKSPNAFRSQTAILSHKGRLLPTHLVRHERSEADWNALREHVRDRGLGDIGALPAGPDMTAETRADLIGELTRDLLEAVRRRYRADYDIFYPDAARSAA
jgi:hypothetical protein